MKRAVIFTNGVLPNREAARRLVRPGDILIAADGGTRLMAQLGLQPRLVVGDLDSAPQEEVQKMLAAKVEFRQYPQDKDETDLELALQAAREFNPEAILIAGALGGRLDQTLANIALLTQPDLLTKNVRLDDGLEEAFFCAREAEVHGEIGDLVSLLPWGAEARGVSTEGLKWRLDGETLLPAQTRGISNEMTAEIARVKLNSGLLLVVHRREKSDEKDNKRETA